jgi:hypothetical protein
VHRDPSGSWSWNYESQTATRTWTTAAAPISVPAAPDLLPSSLGRRLLSEADDGELSRLGARRVAGRDALGLRLVPRAAASSVARVDAWIDAATGIPLQVQVFGKGATAPALDTRFLDLDAHRPAASVTAFTPPPGAGIRRGGTDELVREAARRLRPVHLPATLLGLPRRQVDGVPEGIALYGRGVTLLAVVPVPDRLASGFRQALAQAPGAQVKYGDISVAAGPLSLRLYSPPYIGAYLFVGTVTLDALSGVTGELPQLEAGWLR